MTKRKAELTIGLGRTFTVDRILDELASVRAGVESVTIRAELGNPYAMEEGIKAFEGLLEGLKREGVKIKEQIESDSAQ